MIVGSAQLCGVDAEADLSAEVCQRLLCQATGRTLSLQPITQVQDQGTGQAAVQAPIPSGMPEATGNSSSAFFFLLLDLPTLPCLFNYPLLSFPVAYCPVLVFPSQSGSVLFFSLQILCRIKLYFSLSS